jgi:hypothetical protein
MRGLSKCVAQPPGARDNALLSLSEPIAANHSSPEYGTLKKSSA